MKGKWIVALVGTVLLWTTPAWSHSDEFFDSRPSAHGGQTRMAGPYHLELVPGKDEVTVYVTNHIEQDVPTAGGEGKVVVKAKEGDVTIMLKPAGNNMLKGNGTFTLDQGTVIVLFVKLPEHEAQAARFTPLKPKASAAKPDDDSAHGDGHGHHDHDSH